MLTGLFCTLKVYNEKRAPLTFELNQTDAIMVSTLKSIGIYFLGILMVAGILGGLGGFLIMCYWTFTGGIFDIFATIVRLAQAFFMHDWKLAEVILVFIVVYLVIRKRS